MGSFKKGKMVKTRRSSSANNLESLTDWEDIKATLSRKNRSKSPIKSRPVSPQKKKPKIEERRVSQCVEPNSPRKLFGRPTAGPSRHQNGDAPRQGGKSKYNAAELAKKIPCIDKEFVQRVLDEMLVPSADTYLRDIAGNENAKAALREMVLLPAVRPDLFVGLRAPPKGLLLYGPPGNGKTLLARALANEAPDCNFINVSASSLTSKWVGEGERMVRAVFAVAAAVQPTIIFVDEVDSLLSTRKETDDAIWRLKTEFLIHLDGITSSQKDKITLIAATNIPYRLDQAVLRRFQKRIMIPLPSMPNRHELLSNLLKQSKNSITCEELKEISRLTQGYSGSDLTQLAKDAAMTPLREMTSQQISRINTVRPINAKDFILSMKRVRPSTTAQSIVELEKWTKSYGELSSKNV